MNFFTADLHLGHANIIEFCNRPFNSVEEMDSTIITRWNSVVSHNDHVYILGDFSFRNPMNYLQILNGKKTLILGNHDKNITGRVKKEFVNIYELKTINLGSYHIVLCHYALRVWNRSHYNTWHLYGHSHGWLRPEGKSMDVGVDTNNFYPYSLDDIVKIMDKKPDNLNYIKKKEKNNEYREGLYKDIKGNNFR